MVELNNRKHSYVLLTSAKNEGLYIGETIEAVLNQEILPLKWIILDDGSTDNTNEIVADYAEKHPFIQYIKITNSPQRNFASKVYALYTGIKELEKIEFEFIGILDADITMGKDYYKLVINKFDKNPRLGIAGGICYDYINGKRHKVFNESNSVRGGIQLFRRECFENIGGFLPLKFGGEDAVAQITARMRGWEVVTFENIAALHHRKTGTGGQSLIPARFREGQMEYSMGYLPIYQAFKCIRRLKNSPLIIGSLARFLGFWVAMVRGGERLVSNEFIQFYRSEQRKKLFSLQKYLSSN